VRTCSLVATPVLIAAVLISAALSAWLAAGLCVVLVFVVTRFSLEEWTAVREGFGRYNEPPLARAADCTVGFFRHVGAGIEHRSRKHAIDAVLSFVYILLIILPVLLIKLASHHESLGNPLGLTIGIVVGDLVLELQNIPSRLGRYRAEPEQHSPLWITLALLTVELTLFLVLDLTRNDSSGGFLRSVLTGFVLIAVIHAVAILTTFVAILTDGRPLR
jgi:hypothetical protein